MAPQTSPGRPREFELDAAARDAMHVFWNHGYEAASLPDLIEGTGLSRGSIYKAFGDKKGLLLAALDVYMADGLKQTADLLSQPGSVKEAIRASLRRYVHLSCDAAGRRGCLVVAMAVEQAAHDADIAERTGRMFRRIQQLYAGAIVRGQANGEIREGDEQAMARFLVCQIQGMRVLGKTGASESEMTEIIENAMLVLN